MKKRFLKKSEFPHVKNLKNTLDPQKLEPRVGDTLTRKSGPFQGGSVVRLGLGRQLGSFLPVAQPTNAFPLLVVWIDLRFFGGETTYLYPNFDSPLLL